MSENPSEPVDVRTIHQLVRLMKRYDLTAIDFSGGATKIRLRRQGADVPARLVAAPAQLFATPQAGVPPVTQAAAPATPPPAAPSGAVIESPMVGTYYSSGSPDVPPFVAVGSVVRPDTTVCIIEAMKVFTDIPAGMSGTVTEVLVKNGQAVEFGQPLFRVNPA